MAFVLVEQRSPAPIFDHVFLLRAPFTGALTVAFAAYFGIFSIFFFTALYLQVVVGYSAYRTAVLFVPMAAAMIAASALTGRWVARAGPRLPTAFGCLAAGVGVLATDVALRGHVDFATLAPALALAGLGFGVAVVPVTSVALTRRARRTLRHGRRRHHDEPRAGFGGGRGRAGLAAQRHI